MLMMMIWWARWWRTNSTVDKAQNCFLSIYDCFRVWSKILKCSNTGGHPLQTWKQADRQTHTHTHKNGQKQITAYIYKEGRVERALVAELQSTQHHQKFIGNKAAGVLRRRIRPIWPWITTRYLCRCDRLIRLVKGTKWALLLARISYEWWWMEWNGFDHWIESHASLSSSAYRIIEPWLPLSMRIVILDNPSAIFVLLYC